MVPIVQVTGDMRTVLSAHECLVRGFTERSLSEHVVIIRVSDHRRQRRRRPKVVRYFVPTPALPVGPGSNPIHPASNHGGTGLP